MKHEEIYKLIQKKETIDKLIEFVENPVGFLLLTGDPGRGKSHAAMAIYNSLATYPLPAYDHDIAMWINQAELNALWLRYIKEIGHPNDLAEQIKYTKLFVLDDLGTKQPSGPFMDFLYLLIDKRSNLRKTHGTIITTNWSSTVLREKYSDAFFSRIASGISIVFDYGGDRRLSKDKRFK